MDISKIDTDAIVKQIEKGVAFWNWFKPQHQKYLAINQVEIGARMEIIGQFAEKIKDGNIFKGHLVIYSPCEYRFDKCN